MIDILLPRIKFRSSNCNDGARLACVVRVISSIFLLHLLLLPIALRADDETISSPAKNVPLPHSDVASSVPFANTSDATEGDDAARIATENDAKYDRGRMGFLFGFYNLARDIWVPLADDGYSKAQANLAWMYQTGKGVEKNLKLSYEWYLKAALQDHVIAKNNLGVMYEKGWGVRQSNRRAVYWYRDAAAYGYSYAQYNLGKMLLDGIGTEKNPKEAAYWLGLAAVQGVDEAKGLLINKAKWAPEQQRSNAEELKAVAPIPKQHQLKEVLRDDWILAQPPTSFTLQLLSNKDESVVTRYLDDPHMPDPSAYFKSMVLGEAWYAAIYGVFPTFEEAQKHMRLLPTGITRYKPWIRKFADVHGAIQNPIE